MQNNTAQAARSLAPFLDLWRSKSIDDMEMACAYLLVFCFLRRPLDFLGGQHNLPLPKSSIQGVSGSTVISEFRKTLPESLASAKSLNALDIPACFVSTFCSRSWRSIPFSVQRSVMSWKSGLYHLNLTTRIPSAFDVLEMQSRGERCVSMLITSSELETFVEEGRDVLGFIVHDLIHADHFFHDPLRAAAQVHFCKNLLKVLKIEQINSMLVEDVGFQKEFHYLMSDMNSVPLHLLKTLKAILLGYYKRKVCTDLKQNLPAALENEFNRCFHGVLKCWNFNSEEWAAAMRLNTAEYQHPADSVLLDHALSKNHSLSENYLVFS
ncbi:hypothetical protein ACLVWU_12555 [Bdellovibrio sp. HCB290]|uniref:hypothetical protein n=1 Tax=Bdellovibrio sp. HCB290 TaxID=3394356 RepID=UPI0039B4ADB3